MAEGNKEMTFLRSLILGLTLILAFWGGVSYYERGLALERLRVRISDLEVRFATEARPLINNKYGAIYVNGEEILKNPNDFTEVKGE